MIASRRGFLAGLASMLAAPAIVHAGNLMPVKKIILPEPAPVIHVGDLLRIRMNQAYKLTREALAENLYGDRLAVATSPYTWMTLGEDGRPEEGWGSIMNPTEVGLVISDISVP